MIALEYAKSLFELASISNLQAIDAEFEVICKALEENPDAMKVFTYPNISAEKKKDFIKSITNDCDELLKRFLFVLVDNNRFELIYEIYEQYHRLVINQNNAVDVVVTSATALSNAQIEKLTKLLSNRFKGSKININNIVDANVIGGFKAVANGEQIDVTLKSKLESLKASL